MIENDNKVEVPGLIVETEAEKARMAGCGKNVYATPKEKKDLKDSEKFSDRNVTGENRWQKDWHHI